MYCTLIVYFWNPGNTIELTILLQYIAIPWHCEYYTYVWKIQVMFENALISSTWIRRNKKRGKLHRKYFKECRRQKKFESLRLKHRFIEQMSSKTNIVERINSQANLIMNEKVRKWILIISFYYYFLKWIDIRSTEALYNIFWTIIIKMVTIRILICMNMM